MADTKITNLAALSIPADADVFPIVDISDTSMDAGGTTKKITWSNVKTWINVKNYGAVGDGTADDTSAINAALAVANVISADFVFQTLYFPPGTYSIVPGSLIPITCNIEAGGANFVARTSANSQLVQLGWPGWGNVHINIGSLQGYNYVFNSGNYYGVGMDWIATSGLYNDKAIINIGCVRGFLYGVSLDTSAGGFHIGQVNLNINTILDCQMGIELASGSLEVENNNIHVTYISYCPTAVGITSTGTAHTNQNVITIDAIELHVISNTIGFVLTGANTNQNTIIVNGINYGALTKYLVETDSNTYANLIKLPGIDPTKLSVNGNDLIVDTGQGTVAGATSDGRSIIYGNSPAPSGTWRVGDRYIVNNPTDGGIASYVYVSGGWKAETSASGTWIQYSPTLTGITLGSGTNTARWCRAGKFIKVQGQITLAANSSITGNVGVNLPVTSISPNAGGYETIGLCALKHTGVINLNGIVAWNSTTVAGILYNYVSSTYIATANISSTTPFTWANTDVLLYEYTYEAA